MLKGMTPIIQSISTKDNNFQLVETLKRNRNKRHVSKSFVVESVKAISAALKYGWRFKAVYFSTTKGLSDWGKNIVEAAKPTSLFELSDDLMKSLSDKEAVSEMLVVLEMPEDDLSRIKVSNQSIIVIVDRPASPGNLGSLIRSANAFGASGVVVVGHAADIYDLKTIRSSLGSLFALPVVRAESSDLVLDWISHLDFRLPLIGFSAQAKSQLNDFNQPFPLALVFGNETDGLSKKLKENVDELISIPIAGVASSLNLSCAASIALYAVASRIGRSA